MALITVSGYPASGKSRRATQLKMYLETRLQDPSYEGPKLKVALVSDDTLNIKREVYDDGRLEKPARAALFTAMQRLIGTDTVVIVDAMNYIKGFRYQMYCAAREHRLRVCTLYVLATSEKCREWNASRAGEDVYKEPTLDNLIMRYEEPSSMVRWDSPLFTVPWSDEDIPGDQIWSAITEGTLKAPNAGTSTVAVAPTDALHALEQTSAALVSSIMAEQSVNQGMGGPVTVSVSPASGVPTQVKLVLPARNITLSELQRLKRQFVTIHKKAITLGSTEKGAVDWSEASVAQKFVGYLEENLRP